MMNSAAPPTINLNAVVATDAADVMNYTPSAPFAWVRWLYSGVLCLILPLVPLYLLWRGRKQPAYRAHWRERFALYWGPYRPLPLTAKRRVWLHAVSLGETRASAPWVEAFFAQEPHAHVVLTHTTPTGREAGAQLFAAYLQDGRMSQVYVPYDTPWMMARFFAVFTPTEVWVMETEVWPNMLAQCVRRGIPAALLNARMSQKTLRATLRWPRLMGAAYRGFRWVCAQTTTDEQRFLQLGVVPAQLRVTGNLKFDVAIDEAQIEQGRGLRQLVHTSRRQVVLASSREGEERLWLEALTQPQRRLWTTKTQFWIVPRHPQRFDEVAALIQAAGYAWVRKSALDGLSLAERGARLREADVVLGDTLGEMFAYYALADAVLMGGSWLPYGAHNFIEPLAVDVLTWVGPSVFNFEQAANQACDLGALRQVATMDEALNEIEHLTEAQITLRRSAMASYRQQSQGAVRALAQVLSLGDSA